ncbi:MAG: hypothetical protein ACYSUV_02545 [Planctomycetota bacterium]|jgi:hypothetical protein
MAKDLDALYTEILGEGEPLKEDSDSDGNIAVGDGAYGQEDYSDEAGDGEDPREQEDEDLGYEDEDELFEDEASEEEDADEDGDDGAGEEADEYEEEIPQRLVDAGRQANLSDDAIVELAETRPEALEALARSQEVLGGQQRQKSVQQDASQQDTKKSSTGFKPLELELSSEDEEEMGSKAVSMIKELTNTVNELGGKLDQVGGSLGNVQKQTQMERIRQIDAHFDSLSDEVPELGQTSRLSNAERQNRVFVVETARQAMQVYGVTDQEALAMGVKALKGQKSEASVKQKLLGDLDKNRTRFTARARSRKRPEKKRTTRDRAMEQINRILDSDEY